MSYFANELSIHEQFHDSISFQQAVGRLLAMRNIARQFGSDLHCHRAMLNRNPMPGVTMQQAIGQLNRDQQRVVMEWLARGGPFWDDDGLRHHGEDDWLEHDGMIVTDTAIGEAAFRTMRGQKSGTVSVVPSNWEKSPLKIIWKREAEEFENQQAYIENWINPVQFHDSLRNMPAPVNSWKTLEEVSKTRFDHLIFSVECFQPLAGVPFSRAAADRFLDLLDTLDRLSRAVDVEGRPTPERHRIYRDHFTGDRAWFSGSSETEMREFAGELTFRHPERPGETLFCPWHGKVSHMTLRLHFSWPVDAQRPIYVVYAGHKITKR